MANKTDTNKAEKTVSTLAVSLEAGFRSQVAELSEKNGWSEAHCARVALAALLNANGYKIAEIVQSKKGPKASAARNPLAVKFNLSDAEFSRRMSALVKQGYDFKKLQAYDFSNDPAPVKHRAPKADTAPTA